MRERWLKKKIIKDLRTLWGIRQTRKDEMVSLKKQNLRCTEKKLRWLIYVIQLSFNIPPSHVTPHPKKKKKKKDANTHTHTLSLSLSLSLSLYIYIYIYIKLTTNEILKIETISFWVSSLNLITKTQRYYSDVIV